MKNLDECYFIVAGISYIDIKNDVAVLTIQHILLHVDSFDERTVMLSWES